MSAEEQTFTEPIPPPPDGSVFISQEEWRKIVESMAQYKQIELKYLRMRQMKSRLVIVTFMIANIALFGGMWLAFTGWREALGWAILAFASEELLMGTITYVTETIKSAT